MNLKTTYVLFGVLIAVLVVFLVAQRIGKRAGDSAGYVFPTLHEKDNAVKAKEIQTVKIKRSQPKEQELVFTRSGDGWRLQNPNVRADVRAVDQVVQQVMSATVNTKAEVPAGLKQAGLEPPRAVVTLVGKENREWTLGVGDNTIGDFDAQVYVSSSDRPKEVLAVGRGGLSSLFKPADRTAGGQLAFKEVNDYRATDLLAAHHHDIQYVDLQGGKLGPVILKKTGSDNRWVFEKPPFGEADYQGELIGLGREGAQQGGVQGLLSNLAALRVESSQDFVADGVTDAAKYGLDPANPERLRIEVKTQQTLTGADGPKDPVTTVLLIGNKVEEKKPDAKDKKPDAKDKKPDDKKPEDKEDKYYAALDEGDKHPMSVVKVSGKQREQVLKVLQNPNTLRTRDLVSLDDDKIRNIDWIAVENGKESFQLAKTGVHSWELIDASGKPRKADASVVEQLLGIVREKRQIKEYPDPDKPAAEFGLDKPSATVAFWVEGRKNVEKEPEKKEEDKKDEKKEDKDAKKEDKKDPAPPAKPAGPPTVKLVFGKKDKDQVYVLRELGEDKVRVAVPEALLTRVTQEKLAYLDRELPRFQRADVVKLALVRDGQTFELEKEEKDGKTLWRFKQPEALKGRAAEITKVERVLDDLGVMFAEKLVAEAAGEGELDRYGLKSPAVKATVTLKKDDKTEDRVYSFGKETDDKTGRLHARMSERDWVFLVGPHVLVPLKDELADTTVFTFDPDKVKQLKMTGWQTVIGAPWKFDLERKSRGSWTVKAPPEFKLDDGKAEGLVSALSKLRATKFVALKSGAKPEHKLKLAEGALEIEVTLEGEKEPYALTVGGLSTADKGHFATSNKLPGDVFVLPEGLFTEILKKPAYFAAMTAEK